MSDDRLSFVEAKLRFTKNFIVKSAYVHSNGIVVILRRDTSS